MRSPPLLGDPCAWREADVPSRDALGAAAELIRHPRPRAFRRQVGAADVIAPYGHVWNVTLGQWLDELAAIVFDRPGTLAAGRSWFVVRQEIDYRAETMQGQSVLAVTWIARVERTRASQCTVLLAEDTNRELLRATSEWTLVELATRRPMRVPEEVRARLDPHAVGCAER